MADYGYYSKKLNKVFDGLDELKKAEREHEKVIEEAQLAIRKQREAEEAAKNERAEAAKKIEGLIKQREELNQQINEELDAFYEKYGPFHLSIKGAFDGDGLFRSFFRFF